MHEKAFHLNMGELRRLFEQLQTEDFEIFGAQIKDSVIGFGHLQSFQDLPRGCTEEVAPGFYRMKQREDPRLFQYTIGPESIKKLLHPERRRLWRAEKNSEQSFTLQPEICETRRIALFGIRACDIRAIDLLDQVFLRPSSIDEHYQKIRQGIFIVSSNCLEPNAQCFCSSMGYGPQPERYDINLTEQYTAQNHYFIAHAGSAAGLRILEELAAAPADEGELKQCSDAIAHSYTLFQTKLDTDRLPELVASRQQHPIWDDIAERCLACANCTLVCPSCFCCTTEDITELDGNHSERWLRWDSCFNIDFSFIHGGSIRSSRMSRYRQWLSHKISSWYTQFQSSGCVGCGRCIAWCPVGIDLTAELAKLRHLP